MGDNITTSLSLMRRMPPNKVEQNLSGLLNLLPADQDELLQRIDQPLEEATDTAKGRKFLQCDYNRDGDSYRSPWSNSYYPPLSDGFVPSEKLRTMEIEANTLFDTYRELYYEGGVSSVYLFELDGNGFAGAFLIKKMVDAGDKYIKVGSWDSIHIIEVQEDSATSASYKLTTTVMVDMGIDNSDLGNTNLAGSLTRQVKSTAAINATQTHIVNMGKMIEDMEIDMRSNMNELYVLKTREVISSIRKPTNLPGINKDFVQNLAGSVAAHASMKDENSI
jgi:capping protein (actin filament) muscle Z-line, beta